MKLHKCYEVVVQNTAKGGITANDIAKEMHMHKTVIHHLLNTLKAMKKVQDQHGVWRVKAGEQTTGPLEKEIVIELPLPKDQAVPTGLLEILAIDCERAKFPQTAETYRTLLKKLTETRTITIKGKNVDDLDLEKVQNLILEANQKGSKINLKGFLRSLKRSRADSSRENETKR